MWPDDETSEPAAWINFNAATGERNVSFVCESELASIPLWPEPQPQRKPLTEQELADEWEHVTGHNISHQMPRQEGRAMYISPDEVTEFARAVIAKVTGEKK